MATDWTQKAQAMNNADQGLAIIDRLMEYASDKRGRRSKQEVALYLASVTFAYAVWENFVEEISIELTQKLADPTDGLRPEQMIRPAVRELIERDASVWDLAVYPGWRQRWVAVVSTKAVGGEGSGWGMNTANAKNTKNLLSGLGISPFPDDLGDRLDDLVALRGEIVHTARTTTPVYKAEVAEWRDFVRDLCAQVDSVARQQCRNWLEE